MKADDNAYPSVFLDEQASDPATPAADRWRLFAKSGGIYARNSAGTVVGPFAGVGGSSALDDLTDVAKGTAFPGSPSNNDLCYRTDRDILYFYDGTRWLSVTLYTMQIAQVIAGIAADAVVGNAPVWSNDYDIWMENLHWSSYVQTTNDGSNYWTITLYKRNGAAATAVVTPNTSADAPSVYVTHKTAIGALLGTSEDILTMNAAMTGAPGSLNVATMLTYRLVG